MCTPELVERREDSGSSEAAVSPSQLSGTLVAFLGSGKDLKVKSDAEVRGQNDACSSVMDFQGCAEEFRLHFPQPKAGVVMGRAEGASSLTT